MDNKIEWLEVALEIKNLGKVVWEIDIWVETEGWENQLLCKEWVEGCFRKKKQHPQCSGDGQKVGYRKKVEPVTQTEHDRYHWLHNLSA